jgi:Icc-related predicted phosphoesterase
MRCLVVADLHYTLPQYDWLVAAADQFDLVVFAGDALDLASIVDVRAQIVVVKKYLALVAAKTRVLICSGNHDLEDRSPEGEKIAAWMATVRELGVAADGDDVMIGDTLFSICPWWDGPLVKAAIERQLDTAALRRPARWIWVHHAPPANSPVSWGGKRFFGDTELVGFIARHRPAMVISGHVHQSPFIADGSWFDRAGATWVLNTGRQPGRPPTFIVVDTDAQRAFWLAAGQAEWIDLEGSLQRPAGLVTTAPDWLRAVGRIPDPFLAKPAAAAG